jgi:hypothetical protein
MFPPTEDITIYKKHIAKADMNVQTTQDAKKGIKKSQSHSGQIKQFDTNLSEDNQSSTKNLAKNSSPSTKNIFENLRKLDIQPPQLEDLEYDFTERTHLKATNPQYIRMNDTEIEKLQQFNASLEFDNLVLKNISEEQNSFQESSHMINLEIDQIMPDIENELIQLNVNRYLDSEGQYQGVEGDNPYSVTKASANMQNG